MTQVCKECSCGDDIPKNAEEAGTRDDFDKERLIPGQVSFEACKKACIYNPGCHGMEYAPYWNAGLGGLCFKCYNAESPRKPSGQPRKKVYKLGR